MLQNLRVDPASHVPASLQLKEQLKHLILCGRLEPSTQLPTVRQLAGFLRINRNTVLRALSDLELERLIRSHHGKGVFVAEQLPDTGHASAMQRFVETALRLAAALRLDLGDCAMALLACNQLGESADVRAATATLTPPGPEFERSGEALWGDVESVPRLLMLECNQPVLRLYKRDLEAELGLRVDNMLIADLPQHLTQPDFLSRYALAVTTFFHIEEVEALLLPWGVHVIALLAEASLDTLFRLVRLAPGTDIGIVCEDHVATQNMQRSLERADLSHLRIAQATLDNQEALERMLRRAKVVITSVDCVEAIKQLSPRMEVIVEDGRVDRGALDMLRRFLTASGPLKTG